MRDSKKGQPVTHRESAIATPGSLHVIGGNMECKQIINATYSYFHLDLKIGGPLTDHKGLCTFSQQRNKKNAPGEFPPKHLHFGHFWEGGQN